MTTPIHGSILPPNPTSPISLSGLTEVTKNDGPSFQNMLLGSISETNNLQLSAEQAIEEHLAGGDVTQVEVFSAMKKADLSLRMMMQMRNKIMEAYDEIQQLRM
jgi:flagellar hook-basal body complex protein FliE